MLEHDIYHSCRAASVRFVRVARSACRRQTGCCFRSIKPQDDMYLELVILELLKQCLRCPLLLSWPLVKCSCYDNWHSRSFICLSKVLWAQVL